MVSGVTADRGRSSSDARLGTSVAAAGDHLLVGAPGSSTDVGRVFVYERIGSQWERSGEIAPEDPPDLLAFGSLVALDGDVAAVTAQIKPSPFYSIGVVYVFRRQSSTWQQEAFFEATDGGSSQSFAAAIALESDRLFVGDPDYYGGTLGGAVHVFEHGGSGWLHTVDLRPSDPAQFADFGRAVAAQQDRVLVGAPGRDPPSTYAFHWDGISWIQEMRFDADPHVGSFGRSVAFDGQMALVSSYQFAYFYRLIGSRWELAGKLLPADYRIDLDFGYATAIDGETALLGAPDNLDPGRTGSAYVVLLPETSGSSSNYGEGWPGSFGIPTLGIDRTPAFGTTVQLQIGSSTHVPTIGLFLLGLAAANEDTPLGGKLLVTPTTTSIIVLPGAGASIPISVPCDRHDAGLELYAQVLEEDEGATQGAAFTPGLKVVLGN